MGPRCSDLMPVPLLTPWDWPSRPLACPWATWGTPSCGWSPSAPPCASENADSEKVLPKLRQNVEECSRSPRRRSTLLGKGKGNFTTSSSPLPATDPRAGGPYLVALWSAQEQGVEEAMAAHGEAYERLTAKWS